MDGRVMIMVISSLVAGIFIGDYFFLPIWFVLIPLLIALISYVLALGLKRRNPFQDVSPVFCAVASALFLSLGIFSSSFHRPSQVTYQKSTYYMEGKVEDYTPTNSGDRLLVSFSKLSVIDKEGIFTPLNIRNVKALITLGDATSVGYGSHISGMASLSPVDAPSNFRNEDYVSYLHRKNIFLKGYTNASKCRIETSNSWSSFFQRIRESIEIKIESSPLDIDTKRFLISFLLGDKTYIMHEDRIVFNDAGIAHIFAVSGFHVSMIAVFIIAVLSLIFVGERRKWKYIFCLPIVWFYILLVGASPATCRAGIMISIAMMALFLQRKYNPIKTLGWSIILILAFFPGALFDVGFQLSVVCVGSLLLISAPLNFMNHRSHPKLFKIVSVTLVTLTATFSSWMICAYYFHRFSFLFMPLNLLIVPFLPFYIVLSIVYIFLFSLGWELVTLGVLIDKCYYGFMHSARYITNLSHPLEGLYPSSLSVLLWVSALIILAIVLKKKRPLAKIWIPTCVFFLAIVSLQLFPPSQPEGFIIQKNSSSASIVSYNNGCEVTFSLPENSALIHLNNKKILSLSSTEITPQLLALIPEADIILLCKGCKCLPEGISDLMGKNCLLVSHPSLHWRYDRRILREAKEAGNLSVHSIRYNGPLHVFD